MKLTDGSKRLIDGLSYKELLSRWRFAPVGDPMFQGETGKYYGERMAELRSKPDGNEVHAAASKEIGW